MMHTTPVRMREATFDDHAAIVSLETVQGLKARSYEEWSGIWRSNPLYLRLGPEWPIGWVLEDPSGSIVGAVGNIPLAYTFRGREIIVATGRAWSVDERYRTFALMLLDQYFSQPNVDMFLNTTVNANAVEAFCVFGSKRVPAGDWTSASYFVTGYRGFAESALRIKEFALPGLLSYPAGAALWIKDRITAGRLPRAECEVRRESRFDDRFDAFWETLRQQSTVLLGLRDRVSLDWHFGDGITQNRVIVYTISGPRGIESYAIFQRRDEPRYGLERLRLADFQTLLSNSDHLAAILRRVLRECGDSGIHVLENVGRDLAKTRLFDQYAPYTRKLQAWSYYFSAPDPALDQLLSEPAAWDPSSYDGDGSL